MQVVNPVDLTAVPDDESGSSASSDTSNVTTPRSSGPPSPDHQLGSEGEGFQYVVESGRSSATQSPDQSATHSADEAEAQSEMASVTERSEVGSLFSDGDSSVMVSPRKSPRANLGRRTTDEAFTFPATTAKRAKRSASQSLPREQGPAAMPPPNSANSSTQPRSRRGAVPTAAQAEPLARTGRKPRAPRAVRRELADRVKAKLGHSVLTVPGEGDCLFNSLAVLLLPAPGSIAQRGRRMRADIVAYVEANPDLHGWLEAVEEEPIDAWMARTLADGEYGGSVHVLLAEEMFETCIITFSAQTLEPYMYDASSYSAVSHRPTRALLFDEVAEHYYPLRPDEGWLPLQPTTSRRLRDARVKDRQAEVQTAAPERAASSVGQDTLPRSQHSEDTPGPRQQQVARMAPPALQNVQVTPAPHPQPNRPLFARPQQVPLFARPPAEAGQPVPHLCWPLAAEHYASFCELPRGFPVELAQALAAVNHPPTPRAQIVVPSGGATGTGPTSWTALAACSLAAYEVDAESPGGFTARFQAFLWPGSDTPPPEAWPTLTFLPHTPWHLSFSLPAAVSAALGAPSPAPAPTPLGRTSPATAPTPLGLTSPCPTGDGDSDGMGVSRVRDSVGVWHWVTRTGLRTVRRTEPVTVFGGRTRLPDLLLRPGFFAHNLTTPFLLSGASRMYVDAQVVANPHNPFPVVPMERLHWYAHREEAELGMSVICFEFVPYRDFQFPHLRLAHFLPADIAAALSTGAVASRHQWLLALDGIGATYGVLYAEVFEIQFAALVADIRRLQLAVTLSAPFVEHIIVGRLAAFYGYAMALDTAFLTAGAGQVPLVPRELLPDQWASLLRTEILAGLSSASEMHDLTFSRTVLAEAPRCASRGFAVAGRQPRGSQQPATPATELPTPSGGGNSGRSQLCIPDLLHHYKMEQRPCPGGSTCSAVHHQAVHAWPLHKARRAVAAANLGQAVETSLLKHMASDAKFPTPSASPTPRGGKPAQSRPTRTDRAAKAAKSDDKK